MQRFDVLGVNVNAINVKNVVKIMENWIKNHEQNYICVTNVHLIIEARKDEKLKKILNQSGLTIPDGMPLVWIGKFLGHKIERTAGPDIMTIFSAASAEKDYKNFYYGGKPEVVNMLFQKLNERFPCIKIVGVYSPPFRNLTPEEDQEIVDMINKVEPDVLWVGLGAPKQEKWIFEHIGRIKVPVIIGIGAAFDFLSGNKKRAPIWMQKTGFEWLFRLLSEPKRLWKRYLITNTIFIFLIFSDLVRKCFQQQKKNSKQ